jgi:UDP-glucuronate 4-epimerase
VRASWGTRFETYIRNNLSATQHLLEASHLHPGRRFVFASSSSVYGSAERMPTPEDTPCRPRSPYGATKLAAEHMCLLYHANFGVDVVALRLFSVFGPRQRPDMAFRRFSHAAVTGEPIHVYGDGEQTRDFTYVGDVVAALRLAATTPAASGRVYNIGGGNQVSVNEALQLLGEYADRPLEVQYTPAQHGDVRQTAADTTRAREELGYAPRVGVAEGLRREFDWVLEEGVAEAGMLRRR